MTQSSAAVGVAPLTADERARLGRRAQLLAASSVAYNLVEAAASIGAGAIAGSVALVAFGLDSVIEVSSGLVILWQFRHRLPHTRERQALRLIGVSFFALAAYVTVESLHALMSGDRSAPSAVGIAIACASLTAMPFLSWAQRRTGRRLASGSVVADSQQTLLCTYLSAVLLGGLLVNATLGWWWADPLAGLAIAAVATREGIQAWHGHNCCPPIPVDGDKQLQDDEHHPCGCGPGCTDSCCDASA
jgi:divalent metal cation (Fe/Co/Zn/Cd) transporter